MSMSNTEKTVKDIRRKTRRKHSTEEKIRIVLDGLRGEMVLPYAHLAPDHLSTASVMLGSPVVNRFTKNSGSWDKLLLTDYPPCRAKTNYIGTLWQEFQPY